MSHDDYRTSLKSRLRVLLSPWRALAFAVSLAWFVAGTTASWDQEVANSWLGPLSVLPLLLWSLSTIVTDWSYRRKGAPRDVRSERS
ncbi:hypothetical protein [Microbacterium testaceum]|uniref:hypothetical protein n=1 Tax=Microbacterium testaceum TaxID=2033 RepID=UPI0022E0847B|nr:hypothetical protein [Microbacterium testaceum]